MCEVSLLLIGTIDFHVTAENGRFTSKCNVVFWRTTSNECTKMSHVQHDDFSLLFFSFWCCPCYCRRRFLNSSFHWLKKMWPSGPCFNEFDVIALVASILPRFLRATRSCACGKKKKEKNDYF